MPLGTGVDMRNRLYRRIPGRQDLSQKNTQRTSERTFRPLGAIFFLGLAVSLVQSRGRCADRSRLIEILDSDGILFNKEHVYGLLTRRD